MDASTLPEGLVLPQDPDALRALIGLLPFPVSIREIITDDKGNPRDYRILHYNRAYAEFIQPVVHGTLAGQTLLECYPECDKRMIERTGQVAMSPDPPVLISDAFPYKGTVYRSHYIKIRHGVAASLFIPEEAPDGSELSERMEDRKYRAVIERTNDLFLLLATDHSITGLNETLLNELRLVFNRHLDKRDIIGKHVTWLLPEGTEMPAALAELLERIMGMTEHNDPFGVMDFVHKFSDTGRERSFEIHAYRIHGGIAVMAHETTTRTEAERNLRQADKMRSLGVLAGGIAHDFNNMLTGIKTFSQLLERQLEAGSRQHDCVTHILGSAERAADLTRQLLSFSRQGDFVRQPEDMHAILKDVTTMVKHSVDRRVRIIEDFGARRAVVPVNRTQIQSALLNIALNAVDALAGEGNLAVTTRDTVITDNAYSKFDTQEMVPGRYLAITIADTGCGMSDAVRERLFEPFFTTKKGEKGTGMGMAIVFGTVRAHKGRIDVESAPAEGTAVTVSLPLLDGMPAGSALTGSGRPLRNARILVVDDEQSVRMSLQEALAECRDTLTVCENGERAVAAVVANPDGFDLVLLDMMMPGMDGLDTLREIRRHLPDIPAIFLSGYSDENRKKEAIAEGVAAFVSKPFDIDTLVSAVQEAL